MCGSVLASGRLRLLPESTGSLHNKDIEISAINQELRIIFAQ
jgi:hypothetical protein